ncbi:hypothetical protein KRR26_36425 [Corallococcus sp. M34]|uniref:hypothetical protein n=1 Tax=Citreicoccus inhibens TaxID=2849499 RepID=UPI001C225D1E|nr:hypothetical protein [Citreicoccus inhibens]MBU8901078.1 hypothetical protein [Citreicoccus inhibens]
MTTHLLAALRGEGMATEIDPASNAFVITMHSIHAHVHERVLQALSLEPMWMRKYMAPELEARGPAPVPLLTLDDVPDAPLSIHIAPDAAASGTRIDFAVRRMPLPHLSLPPRSNHETLYLPPQRYSIKVESRAGKPEPTQLIIDVRTTRELNVLVSPADSGSPAPIHPEVVNFVAAEPTVMSRSGGVILKPQGSSSEEGTLVSHTVEPAAVIRVVGLEPPYAAHEARGKIQVTLPTGPYRVSFRMGTEVFGVRDVYVLSGEQVQVIPNAALQASIDREKLGRLHSAGSVPPAESLGPMQGAVLQTLLPIIGLKAFDEENTFFRRGRWLVPKLASSDFGHRPVVVLNRGS